MPEALNLTGISLRVNLISGFFLSSKAMIVVLISLISGYCFLSKPEASIKTRLFNDDLFRCSLLS